MKVTNTNNPITVFIVLAENPKRLAKVKPEQAFKFQTFGLSMNQQAAILVAIGWLFFLTFMLEMIAAGIRDGGLFPVAVNTFS